MVRPLDYQMGVEDEILAQIRNILQQAVSEIGEELASEPTGAIGDALSRAQARAIATAAKSHLQGDWNDIREVLGEGRKLAAAAATQAFWDQIEEPLSTIIGGDGFNSLVRSQAVSAASRIDTVMARLSESKRSLSEQVWQTRALANGWIDSRINQALARGWDAQRLAKEVVSMVDPNSPGGVSYAAMRLARTEINNAFHSQTMEAMRNSGVVEYVKWNLSRSHPDRDICDDLAEHLLGEDVPGVPPKPDEPSATSTSGAESSTSSKYREELDRADVGDMLENVPDLLKNLANKNAPGVQEAFNRILDNGISIQTNSDALGEILKDGRMKNIHEISAGYKSEDYIKSRLETERKLGVPDSWDIEEYPIYGHAGTTSFVEMLYGDITIHIDRSLMSRTTWTWGDTMGASDNGRPVWTDEIQRGLTLDEMARSGAESALLSGADGGPSDYFEAQIYGGVGVKDISGVTFPEKYKDSNPELIRALTDLNIEVLFR